jgi:prefoldin subunit 5
MRTRGRLLLAIAVVCLLVNVVLPCVNAEVFDIGSKISESDLELRARKLVYFDSGTTAYVEPDYIDYISPIFDGNESTGIDHDFGPGHDVMWIELMFPHAIYVSNITVKPAFGGGSAIYTLYLNSDGIYSPWMAEQISTEEIFHINCSIIGVWLQLENGGTNHFYFNDVIINYTSTQSSMDDLQNAIDNLTAQLDDINIKIDELNNSINILNVTPQEINDITDQINSLDSRIDDLDEKIDALNVTPEEINDITDQLNGFDVRINELNNSINVLDPNQHGIIENIANLVNNYNHFNESLANYINDIGNAEDRIFTLETENTALKHEIENLTSEIGNLTLEVEEIKDLEKEKIIERKPDNVLVYAALIPGILGVVIAIGAMVLFSKRMGSDGPSKGKEET